MKKSNKIIVVLLSITMLFSLPVSVLANTVHYDNQSNDAQIIPMTNEVKVDTGENNTEIIESYAISDGSVMPLSQTSGIISGAIYRIKNVGSGKYMNVHYGVDANGTNIYQWTADGSTEQKFRVVYSSTTDSYMLYAMCSSTRVVSVARSNSGLLSGQNVQLYTATDQIAQQMRIISLGQNQYRIGMSADYNVYLAAYGNSNGSSGGVNSNSAGNIYLSNYVGEMYQHWMFELLEPAPDAVNPTGYLDSVSISSINGWAWQSNIPNTPLTVHIYIKNNSDGTETLLSTMANIYRGDLALAGYGDGYHGFSCSINWKTYKPGTYTVRAYALGVNSGNPQLTNVMSYIVRNTQGTVDSIGNSTINGWAWKPDAPNEVIEAHAYIYRSSGALFTTSTATANIYRGDLQSAGYGNGYHGFTLNVDFSTLPEERLHFVIYAVDGSNYNTSFYDGYYDNRRPITLLGMKESKYHHDLSAWMWSNDVVNYCQNIGCTAVNRYNYATENDYNYSYTRYIKESSYCAIFTHGLTNGREIEWSMYGIYHSPSSNQEYGFYTIDDLDDLPNNYFSGTRCVVLMSCFAGLGGASNPNNFVNTLQSKGVQTVVGFANEITYYYNYTDADDYTTHTVVSDLGAQLWAKEFTRLLGEGKTVAQATENATLITYNTQVENERLNGIDNVDDYCGLNSHYIAGNANQIVKH